MNSSTHTHCDPRASSSAAGSAARHAQLKSSSRGLRPTLIASSLVALGALAACSTPSDRPSPLANAVSNTSAALRADDDMKTVLDTFASLNPKAIEKISVEEARAQPTFADAVKGTVLAQGRDATPTALVPGVSTRDGTIPSPAGRLPVRVYTPQGQGPFPVIVYFHGGGWVLADREVYDGGARGLAKQANAVVLSVDYRRAPEAKFPAAWDDALASYRWAVNNARAINGDGRLALAGESAGGNLAMATAIAARDAGMVQPKHVLAVYPVAQTGSLNTPSYIENAAAKPLNRPMIEWFLDKLLRTPADKQDTRLDLVNADLRGLPPVTIINARLDPLRSDGAMLEDALKKAGVSVERKDYAGVTHEFFGGAAVLQKAREAQAYAGQRLMQSFGQ
ncbi:alpha/beta hydrolase [Pigmentiphaga aceris]|uniref:Alpha/beta hydrolase n=1 Tax=Pigmentiphaga aceris TaxID=1940612 RepID=A0A5C0B3V7_9BURK|nr:alpha/beta hydrolase [Pigmentiphaga aceris]QEI07481.1 alpha/beta hydrolase [Pigmentiphaga aceris]